ncbi:replication initiator protein [Dipodfec virus RodF1_17]|uniref:Replication initiator protein n=1 Tax=Dipodfec virus RodF1_17 TaxID=2929293 RepID=A0A976R7Y5_9VIRU|nr:replication initiator protein [Dipodfec virus RodF1_17]
MRTNSRYLNPANAKMTLSYPVQNTFSYNYRKEQSYLIRNFYHYKYIKSIGGEAYFYTFTYNNRNLPHWFGHTVCDNSDLRWFLNDSGFRQLLRSKYGVRLGYFITTEYGEGKGKRGKGNNPHYHAIFYLWTDDNRPVNDIVNARLFKHLVQYYWQGSFKNPRFYKKGKADPSNFHGLLGRLENEKAVCYCCKYVTKDSLIENNLNDLKLTIYREILRKFLYKRYFIDYFDLDFFALQDFLEYDFSDPFGFPLPINLMEAFEKGELVTVFPFLNRVFNLYYKKTFRNRYSPKVFMSQGIGISALDYINVEEATIPLSDPKLVVKNVPIPLYLYRKFYCDVVKDTEGNNRYILNDYGIEQRVNSLQKKLEDLSFLARSVVDAKLTELPECFADDFYTLPRLFERYAQYKLIYEDRLCNDINRPLNPYLDFEIFMVPSFHFVEQDEFSIYDFDDVPRYSSHSFFKPYIRIFEMIDDILQEYFLSKDRFDKEECNKRRAERRQLNATLHNFK